MKNEVQKSACEAWEELISAYCDRELSVAEADAVEEHLATCPGCRETEQAFLQVNGYVVEQVENLMAVPLAAEEGHYSVLKTAPAAELKTRDENPGTKRTRGSAWRLIPAMVAGTVAASLFLLPSEEDPKSTLTAEEIARPLVELEMIERQQQRDQLLMIKTLELDLRALKIELSQVTSAKGEANSKGLAKSEALTQRIDALIEKTNQIETQNLSFQYENEAENETQN